MDIEITKRFQRNYSRKSDSDPGMKTIKHRGEEADNTPTRVYNANCSTIDPISRSGQEQAELDL